MATLTETAYYTRNFIKYGSIAAVLIFVLKISWGIFSTWWITVNPPPPPPPTIAFGKLPKINFSQITGLPNFTYKLETIQGSLPTLQTVAKVYVVAKNEGKFSSLDEVMNKARRMGFTNQPETLSETKFRFSSASNPPTILELDKITGDFQLKYDYQNDQTILNEQKPPNNDQAVAEAKRFLQNVDLLKDDITNGPSAVSYWRFQPPNLIAAISLSEANFVKVGLNREGLDNIPIVSENPQEPFITFLFSGARSQDKRILEINYHYSLIERQSQATYPLKTTTLAWQELQENKGYIASLGENNDGLVTIRKVTLGYFDLRSSQNFLQPVFVFEGDRNFTAYIAAVDQKYVE
jgi:hypothetical protein